VKTAGQEYHPEVIESSESRNRNIFLIISHLPQNPS
jgi:hypothetical protein